MMMKQMCFIVERRSCDIGQESAYTCKLQELPTGTSQRLSSLCNRKGSTQMVRYLFLRNNIKKRFLLRKLLRNIPYLSRDHIRKKYPTHGFHLRNLLKENILLAVKRRQQSWNCSQTTTNLLSDPRVLHIYGFASKSVSFVLNCKTLFKLIISISPLK